MLRQVLIEPKCKVVAKRPLSILMVEDDKLISIIHTIMLQDLNCIVETAATAKEALEKADHPYDLILLDVGLPDMKGTELAAQLRLHPKHQHTWMVFVTTVSADGLRETCAKLTIDQIINKPVDKRSFKGVITRLQA